MDKLVPFREFVESLKHEHPTLSDSLTRRGADGVHVLGKYRAYLLRRYEQVDVPHSFMDDAGQTIDCIPIDQQPSRRARPGERLATPPRIPTTGNPAAPAPAGVASAPSMLPPALSAGGTDRHGNVRACPAGTVPIVRTTLEQLARFDNLDDFFRKAPGGGRLAGDTRPAGNRAAVTHRYAHAIQPVPNIGGASVLNIWQVPIAGDQVFSLTQQWYVAGSGAGTQTAECGLQVFPQKYNTALPVLFIYYTSANYADGSGCYNLDCGAFTQTNSSVVIGGLFANVSQPGGQQFEAKLGYICDSGTWWLYYSDQPIGYYSNSLYNGGAMTVGAESVDFGGETVGVETFPPMGSGAFPEQGFGFASYHRNIQYFPTSGGYADATLFQQQPSPGCYQINVLNNSGTSWGSHFFFGGPGGAGC